MLSFRGRFVPRWSTGDVSGNATPANCDTAQKGFPFVTTTGHSRPGSPPAGKFQDGTSRAMPSPRWAGHQGSQPFLEAEHTELQELLLDRLHIVNSFTLVEIPTAVWPREWIWSPFKGPSSEFPALAFSYLLSLLSWALQSCRTGGWGGGKKGRSSPRAGHSTHCWGNGAEVCVWV